MMSQALKATFSGFTKEQQRLGIPKGEFGTGGGRGGGLELSSLQWVCRRVRHTVLLCPTISGEFWDQNQTCVCVPQTPDSGQRTT